MTTSDPTAPTNPDGTAANEHALWCPMCKEWRGEVLPATKPLNGYGPQPNRCTECDSTLVLKKVELAE